MFKQLVKSLQNLYLILLSRLFNLIYFIKDIPNFYFFTSLKFNVEIAEAKKGLVFHSKTILLLFHLFFYIQKRSENIHQCLY